MPRVRHHVNPFHFAFLSTGAPTAGQYKPISTAGDFQICELMPELAKQGKNFSIVRSMSTREADHNRGRYYMHTAYVPNPDGTAELRVAPMRARSPGVCVNLAFSPDGRFLASGGEGLVQQLWAYDIQSGQHIQLTGETTTSTTPTYSREEELHDCSNN